MPQPVVLAAVMITLVASLLGVQVERVNAASWSTKTTSIVYLMGTANKKDSNLATTLQDHYQYIYRSLSNAARLAVPLEQQVVINYTNASEASRTNSPQRPRVVSSYTETRPVGAPIKCPVFSPDILDGWRHAYQTAWKLHTQFSATSQKIILIGHSQGGMIARIIQLIAAGKIPTKTQTGGEIDPSCWPQSLKSKIIGIVTMGAPLNSSCPGFVSMLSERQWITSTNLFNAGKVLVIGADPKEVVVGVPGVNSIELPCATNIFKGVTRVAIYAKEGVLHDHRWYVEGNGNCFKRLLPAPDGKMREFCAYQSTNGSNFPTSWVLMFDRTAPSNPGTIYDVIAQVVQSW